jgi:hypothetical protein
VISHKAEALKAIAHVTGMLAEPLDPLQKRLAVATLEHAKVEVEAIEELKHKRRAKEATDG